MAGLAGYFYGLRKKGRRGHGCARSDSSSLPEGIGPGIREFPKTRYAHTARGLGPLSGVSQARVHAGADPQTIRAGSASFREPWRWQKEKYAGRDFRN